MSETLIKPVIVKKLLESLQTKFEEEQQVIVHCCFPASPFLETSSEYGSQPIFLIISQNIRANLFMRKILPFIPTGLPVPFMKDFWFTLGVFRVAERL
jgi:hypothetical protein